MIKRILIALVIVAVALVGMHFLIGFENFANAGDAGSRKPVLTVKETPPAIVVGNADRDSKSPIAVALSGPFELEPKIEIPAPDGSRRRLRRYSFKAEDSATVSADVVHLDRVTVLVFRIDQSTEPPREEHVATITAREAIVQLGRDAEGRPSIREDRDMDLADVVVESAPTSRLRDLRLTIAHALVRQDDDGVRIHTPDEREPFTVTMGGSEPLAITGKGLDAFLPRQGDAEAGELRLDVAREPEVVRGDLRLIAEGALRYREDVATGSGRLTLREKVVMTGELAARDRGAARASGDLLDASIRRWRDPIRVGKGQRAGWDALALRGAPVTLDAVGMRMTCGELLARPALGGEPAILTASGEPRLDDLARHATFRAKDRIHVIDLGRTLAPMHAMVGFAPPSLGRLARQLILFEGRSTVEAEDQGTTLIADSGLRALRGDGEIDLVVGTGDVRVESERFELVGDHGFLLARTSRQERVRLGREQPDGADRFRVVEKVVGRPPMTISGHGTCEVLRKTDGAVVLAVRAPAADVEVQRGDDVLSLVRTFDASFDADRNLQTLVATGDACTIDSRLVGPKGSRERGRAVGQRIESRDGRSVVVAGAPAEVQRAGGGRLVGDRIDTVPFGRAPAVIVRGNPARVLGLPVRSGRAVGEQVDTLDLSADRIVFLPSLLPPAILRAHAESPRSWHSVARPVVIAQGSGGGVLSTRRSQLGEQTGSARGDLLVLRPEHDAALLVGVPAELEQRESSGRGFVARAERLRGFASAGRPRVELMLGSTLEPQVDLLAPDAGSSLGNLRVTASVPIVLDGSRIHADGQVRLRGIDRDGAVDPAGIDLSAIRFRAEIDPATGAIRSIEATRATLLWRGMKAFAERLGVDVTRRMIEIEGKLPDGAWLEIGGYRHSWSLLEIDYETRELRGWGGHGQRVRID